MSTQTRLIHGLHMDILKTVDNINISIKHYNGFVIHLVKEICAIAWTVINLLNDKLYAIQIYTQYIACIIVVCYVINGVSWFTKNVCKSSGKEW